jgi:hypothetical protein
MARSACRLPAGFMVGPQLGESDAAATPVDVKGTLVVVIVLAPPR